MTGDIPFATTGAYPIRAGNLVRPLVDGEAAFRRICEAVEAAQHSVWVAVTFVWPEFRMPDGRGSFFDVLDDAVARGIDVRMIPWRPGVETASLQRNAFWGSAEHRAMLEQRRSKIIMRWDRAHPGFCQHQKVWLIDAGHAGETAFVGGINQNPHSVVAAGHHGEGHNHDVYVELRGPCVADVHHNFVQRWNEASDRRLPGGAFGHSRDLPFPSRLPEPQGDSVAQVQRTIHSGLYTDGRPSPGGKTHDVAGGERSILEQYGTAIAAARRSIYVENQFLEAPEVVGWLRDALERGVEIVVLVPGQIDPDWRGGCHRPERKALLEARGALGQFETFTLAAIAGLGPDGMRKDVYVHAKLMLVDDAWASVGSANFHRFSLHGNAEMNLSFRDAEVVKALRCELFHEHLGQDTSSLDDRTALRLYRRVAEENRLKRLAGDQRWRGLAFRLEPETYGHGGGAAAG